MRLLLVEDDPELAAGLQRDLQAAGYAVDLTDNAAHAAILGAEEPYDLVILDLGLPDGSGLEVLRRWRDQGNAVPVLVLTARDAWVERVDGFRAGADDYVGKPFHTEELLARVGALLRRAHGRPAGPLACGALALDEERQQVSVDAAAARPLTATEFRLLRYLMLNPGRILSKSRLAEHVYDFDDERESNVLEVYINRLRGKIGRQRILTHRGQGYELRPDP